MIQEAEKLKESDYTEASWQVFQEALQDAKSVNEEKEPKQEDVDRAAKELTEAMEALVPVGKLPYIDVADTDWFLQGSGLQLLCRNYDRYRWHPFRSIHNAGTCAVCNQSSQN